MEARISRGSCSMMAPADFHTRNVASKRPLGEQYPARRASFAFKFSTSLVIWLCRKCVASSPVKAIRPRSVSGATKSVVGVSAKPVPKFCTCEWFSSERCAPCRVKNCNHVVIKSVLKARGLSIWLVVNRVEFAGLGSTGFHACAAMKACVAYPFSSQGRSTSIIRGDYSGLTKTRRNSLWDCSWACI